MKCFTGHAGKKMLEVGAEGIRTTGSMLRTGARKDKVVSEPNTLVRHVRYVLTFLVLGFNSWATTPTIVTIGGNTHAWWFEPSLSGLSVSTPVQGGPYTITNGADIITWSEDCKAINFNMTTTVVVADAPETITYYSENGLLSVNPTNGNSVSIGTGVDDIVCRSESLERRLAIDANISQPGYDGYTEDLNSHSYVAGSLKESIISNFYALVSGHDGSDSDLAVYSTMNHSSTNYVRNTNCWAYPLDITCCSPWNSNGGRRQAGTLITPKHLILAKHYNPPVGTVFRFVDNSNNVYERTSVASAGVLHCDITITNVVSEYYFEREQKSPTNYYNDFTVHSLDSPLPASIVPVKRLPPDWLDYIPYTHGFTNYYNVKRYQANYPIVIVDQYERATIGESFFIGLGACVGMTTDYGNYVPPDFFMPPAGRYFMRRTTFAPFYRDKIAGDSGSPMLLYVGNEPVLTGCLTRGGGGASLVDATWCYDSIQQTIYGFGDTNVWESVDLSGYTEF